MSCSRPAGTLSAQRLSARQSRTDAARRSGRREPDHLPCSTAAAKPSPATEARGGWPPPGEHRRFLAHPAGAVTETDRFIFVHAGLRPGIPLELTSAPDDLLWIRQEFLTSSGDWGETVVFGHTPRERPLAGRTPHRPRHRLRLRRPPDLLRRIHPPVLAGRGAGLGLGPCLYRLFRSRSPARAPAGRAESHPGVRLDHRQRLTLPRCGHRRGGRSPDASPVRSVPAASPTAKRLRPATSQPSAPPSSSTTPTNRWLCR